MISPHRLPLTSALIGLCLLSGGRAPAQEIKNPAGLVKQALDSPNVDRQQAALVLIPELGLKGTEAAATARHLEQYLARTTDEQSKALALVAYGKLAPSLGTASGILRAGFADRSPGVRRAAGTALVDLIGTAEREFGKPSTVPTTGLASSAVAGAAPFVYSVREWARFGEDSRILLAFCSTALKDPDDQVKTSGAEGIQLLARTVAEVLPDPGTSVADTKVIDPLEAKWKWLLLQPVFAALNGNVSHLRNGMSAAHFNTRKMATSAAEAVAQVRSLALASRRYPPDNLAMLVATPPPEDALRNVAVYILPALAERLDDESPEIRLIAIEGFEHQGAEARPYLGAIIHASTSADIFVRWVATRTLGRLFTGASPAETARIVQALEGRIRDDDIDVRTVVLTALGKGGPKARSATASVLALVAAGDPDQRVLAVKTLALIDAERDKALPVLGAALRARASIVRKAVVSYLGTLGRDARPIVPSIRPLLFDENEEVRKEAARALLAIE